MGSAALLMNSDSWVTSRGPTSGAVTTRREWFQIWTLVGPLLSIIVLYPIIVCGGLTVGITYLKGRIPEAEKQV